MEEQRYDHVVVGSGISGLTAALLLAEQGGSVLIIEKAPAIGGSMARFSLDGVPFDTGFHFTGGLAPSGLLHDMLKVLNIERRITPVPFSKADGICLAIEASGSSYALPCDKQGMVDELCKAFPGEMETIHSYFSKVDEVCDQTANMNLRRLGDNMPSLDEDYQSVSDVLDGLTSNRELKAILSSNCLCYGVAPSEISFANHARICQNMYEGTVRVDGGGDAFVTALKDKLDAAGVEIRCKRHIVECEEIEDHSVGAFRLNTGELVRFSNCVLTIHPKAILDLLPRDSLRKAFVNRVSAYEQSFGFFSVFGVCDDPDLLDDCALTILPGTDLDAQLKPGHRDTDSALFFVAGKETVKGKVCRAITVLEAAFPEDMEEWAESSLMKRSESYTDYKAAKTKRITERILSQFPQLEGHLDVLGSSSPLTFRDYLHSPDGSAYGVKQKIGQFNLLGRLPLRNLFAAGQSSVLPGVMGAMVSSFIVCRTILDREEFDAKIKRRLDA